MRTVTTNSAEETEAVASAIGQQLKGGEVIELASDLGGGKTTFTRGLVKGAGSDDHVSSPTFTISNEYKVPSKNHAQGPSSHSSHNGDSQLRVIKHYDFYRLPEAGLIEHELADYLGSEDTVIVIEWAQVIKKVLPKNCIQIEIRNFGESKRTITINIPDDQKRFTRALENFKNN